MKKLLFLLTFLPIVAFAREYQVRGYVHDFTSNQTLANVTVFIADSLGDTTQTLTNSNGFFLDTVTISTSGGTVHFWIDPCEPGLKNQLNFRTLPYSPGTNDLSNHQQPQWHQSLLQCNTGCDYRTTYNFYTLPYNQHYLSFGVYDANSTRNYSVSDGSTKVSSNLWGMDTVIVNNPAPGNFWYCATWGNNCQVCDTIFTPISCNAEYIVDTVNSFGGTVVLWNTSITATSNATYHWDFGDGNSSTDPYPFHQYAAAGTYAVCLTVTDSICTSTYCDTLGMDANGNLIYKGTNTGFSLQVLNPNTIGVEENHLSGLSIYPNPAKDVLTVSGDFLAEKSTQIEIMDMTGRTVARYDGETVASGRLEVGHLPRGMYMLQITNKTNRESRKLLLD